MSQAEITRYEESTGLLYLDPDLSGGWLVYDAASGCVIVDPDISNGSATYDPQTGLLTFEAPVYATNTISPPNTRASSSVYPPDLAIPTFVLEAARVSRLGRPIAPAQMIPGPVTLSARQVVGASNFYTIALEEQDVLAALREQKRRSVIRRTIAGYFGPTEMRTIVAVCDNEGRNLGHLDGIRGCSFEVNNNREATWSLSLEMDRNRDFNPVEDYVKLIFQTRIRDGRDIDEWLSLPQGIYRFRNPGGEYFRSHATWSLSGESLESVLSSPIRQTFDVEAGKGVLAVARNILLGAGIPETMINLPLNEDRALTTAQSFEPVGTGGGESSEGTKLKIINSLLAAGGFAALWTDRRGRFTTRRLLTLANQPPAIRYAEDGEILMLDGVSEEKSDERFANMVVVSSEDPEQEPPIRAIALNNDPTSPGSFDRLGYWKCREVKMKTLASAAAATEVAQAQLKSASSYLQTVSFRTRPDSERTPRERIEAVIPGGEGAETIEGIFKVSSFGGECHPMPRELSFTASRVRDVGEGWS